MWCQKLRFCHCGSSKIYRTHKHSNICHGLSFYHKNIYFLNAPNNVIYQNQYQLKIPNNTYLCRCVPLKYCTAEEWTCGKCGGHSMGECFNTRLLQCRHCGGNHQTGHRSCLKQLEEHKILSMQLKYKISWTLVKQEYNKRYPERGESYASKVTGTVKVMGDEVKGYANISLWTK